MDIMANYYSSARTNYFRVKDVDAFNAWAKEYEDNYRVEVVDKEDTFSILFDNESPEEIICKILPEILIKGSDYKGKKWHIPLHSENHQVLSIDCF